MGDVICASNDELDRLLRESLTKWSFYVDRADKSTLFPCESLDLKNMLGIPAFSLNNFRSKFTSNHGKLHGGNW
jgi:hypothetical protein